MEKVGRGIYSFEGPEWNQISNEAKNFIRRMLEFDVDKRISASDAINDPWIKKYSNKSEVDIPLMSSALTNMRNFRVKNFSLELEKRIISKIHKLII